MKTGGLYERIERYKIPLWVVCAAFLVVAGCFEFPLGASGDPWNLVADILAFAVVGLVFSGLIRRRSGVILVFGLSLLFLAMGLGCRYGLELGEVSNEINFTFGNVSVMLLAVPAGISLVFQLAAFWRDRTCPRPEEIERK